MQKEEEEEDCHKENLGAEGERVEFLAASTSPTTSKQSSQYSTPCLARCTGRIARSSLFQMLTIMMIVLNALWIGADVEWNHTSLIKDNEDKLPLEPWSVLVAWFFCIFFTGEITLRFLSYRKKVHCLTDAWFVFDSTLVLFMVLETWILPLVAFALGSSSSGNLSSLSSLRLIRLLRLARMGRLMQFFPELLTLVKGMVTGFNGTMFILLFLAGITYIFAIAFTSQVAKPPHERDDEELTEAQYMFGSLGSSMMTLFTNGMLGDNLYQTMTAIKDDSMIMYWLFIVYFCISAMTLLNMLIGILVDVINRTASQEEATLQQKKFEEDLRRVFMSVDIDKNQRVTTQEWDKVMKQPELRATLMSDIKLPEDEDEDEYLMRLKGYLFGTTNELNGAGCGSAGDLSNASTSMPSTSGEGGEQQASRCLDPNVNNAVSSGAVMTVSTSCRSQYQGLTFGCFMDKMSGMLPGKRATALEVEMLAQKLEVLDQVLLGKLHETQDMVKDMSLRAVGMADDEPSGMDVPEQDHLEDSSETLDRASHSIVQEYSQSGIGISGTRLAAASADHQADPQQNRSVRPLSGKANKSLVTAATSQPLMFGEPWSMDSGSKPSAEEQQALESAMDDLPPDWLQKVPMDILLQLLKEHVQQKDDSSQCP